jgi:hypothetical protein
LDLADFISYKKAIGLPRGKSLSRRERGTKLKKTLREYLWYPSPDPLSRVTLSRRERDFLKTFPIHGHHHAGLRLRDGFFSISALQLLVIETMFG